MIGRRFERVRCLMRWFFNASPDWSESRSHATESETMFLRDNESDKAFRTTPLDTSASVDIAVNHRKDR